MKILFITYPMAFHTPGGGEIQLLAYKEALEKKGIHVDFFDPWNPRFTDYDVVHYFSCVGGSIHICNFVKQLNIPLVVTSSLWMTEETKELYPLGEIVDQFNIADFIVANSDIECNQLSKILNININKFKTVYNGIDDTFTNKIDESLFFEKFHIKNKYILSVANIEERKNQLHLAEAMKSFPDYKLVLIGHIRNNDYYENIRDLLGDQLIYIGSIDHSDPIFRSAYCGASAFVLPSILETPGLAALEAAAMEIPVVVTEVGSTTEYFLNDVSYSKPDDVSSIVSAIDNALNNTKEESLRNLSQRIKKSFSWSSAAEKLISIYNEVMIK
ncbi:glycosyltransferase family 4 protein [Vibrio sp. MEBiC08052]|uniref:glycosyltransferase family 4 protein n=1 Tax=Vibrio sp. MEBiC08052 TaxID=1761910 RepID=UPI00074135FE|nr:glycosyltransferase family 4 protein [Vibrio sp. MEBiC08052]